MSSFTVAIPTYNRPDELVATVERLIPQLNERWTVLVIDNCSTVSASESLASVVKSVEAVSKFRLIRNVANIGANANIVRCVELATTDWIWLLGDDDLPAVDSINKIESYCMASEQTFIKFICRDMQVWAAPQRISRIEESSELGVAIGDLLFLSTSVVHGPSAKKCLHSMTLYSYSCAPHVVLLDAMLRNDKALFVDFPIVGRGVPTNEHAWSYFVVSLRMRTLLDYPWTSEGRRWIQSQVMNWAIPWKGALRTCSQALHTREITVDEFGSLLKGLASYMPFFPALLLFAIGITSIRFPGIARGGAYGMTIAARFSKKEGAKMSCSRL